MKKAGLIVAQYNDKFEHEYEMNPLSESFMLRHEEIDSLI